MKCPDCGSSMIVLEIEDVEMVRDRLAAGVDALTEAGIDRGTLTDRMILTPACGCSGITVEQAGKVYRILSDLEAVSGDLFGDR